MCDAMCESSQRERLTIRLERGSIERVILYCLRRSHEACLGGAVFRTSRQNLEPSSTRTLQFLLNNAVPLRHPPHGTLAAL
jgi:hypothetical protein